MAAFALSAFVLLADPAGGSRVRYASARAEAAAHGAAAASANASGTTREGASRRHAAASEAAHAHARASALGRAAGARRSSARQASATPDAAIAARVEIAACPVGADGLRRGCRSQAGCHCAWTEQCYSTSRRGGAAFAAEGSTPQDVTVDIGICSTAIPVLVVSSVVLFVLLLFGVVSLRMYFQAREAQVPEYFNNNARFVVNSERVKEGRGSLRTARTSTT